MQLKTQADTSVSVCELFQNVTRTVQVAVRNRGLESVTQIVLAATRLMETIHASVGYLSLIHI